MIGKLTSIVALSLFATRAAAQGGFAQSCDNIVMFCPSFGGECGSGPGEYYLLAANCNSGGSGHETDVTLSEYFGNVNGHLVGKSGGFAGTCRNCYLSGTVMHCECGDGHGGWPSTSIDLNSYCTNSHGTLKCAT